MGLLEESLSSIIEGPLQTGAEAARQLMAANLDPCNTKKQNLSKRLPGKLKVLFLPVTLSLIVPCVILQHAIQTRRIFPIFRHILEGLQF